MTNLLLGTLYTTSYVDTAKLYIDGEDEPTKKYYHMLSSYEPGYRDRVLVADIGDSYIILGAIK